VVIIRQSGTGKNIYGQVGLPLKKIDTFVKQQHSVSHIQASPDHIDFNSIDFFLNQDKNLYKIAPMNGKII
jgi:hypothetical protein